MKFVQDTRTTSLTFYTRIFIVNYGKISHIIISIVTSEQVNSGWVYNDDVTLKLDIVFTVRNVWIILKAGVLTTG